MSEENSEKTNPSSLVSDDRNRALKDIWAAATATNNARKALMELEWTIRTHVGKKVDFDKQRNSLGDIFDRLDKIFQEVDNKVTGAGKHNVIR